ncbi:MAG: thermonuclease family protein [bacterium]|nr:thermonuclease family protein [bacterium]
MFPKTKLWQLYILPLIVIGVLLLQENIGFVIEKNESFETIAAETTSVEEVAPNQFEKAFVKEVVDGDTLILDSDKRVRFIGVDTPETVHPKKSVQCYGREASNKTKALLNDKWIYLEKDVSETDRYARLLRYIYLPNPNNPNEVLFVNEYLIEQGYGTVITYPPDVKYHDRLVDAQRMAQDEKRGLWGECK